MNETRQYEETIDLCALMAQALRKWPVLLAAMLIGAMLLGGYRELVPVDHTSEIEAIQLELDKNLATFKNNEKTIELSDWMEWEKLLPSLERSLKECQDLLTDPSLSINEYTEIIAQVNILTENILKTQEKIKSIENILEENVELQEQIDEQETMITALSVTRVSLKTILKYAILGAALGAFIFCGVIFLQFILDHRLRASVELKERFNLPILGEFSSDAAKKHGKFGQWLDKLSGDVQTLPGEQQVYELIVAGMQTSVAMLPMQLAVTGTVSKEVLEQIGGQLKSLLPDTYKIKVETNPVYNAAFLVDLKQYVVLLVEAKGVSDKREIEKLAEILHRNQVKVIGAVVT